MLIPIGDDNPTRRFSFVNIAIIVVNLSVMGYFFFTPSRDVYQNVVYTYGMVPGRVLVDLPGSLFSGGVTFVTSLFLHGSLAHLFGNMLFLWIVGDNVEDRLGHLTYLLYYLGLGIAAGAGHLFMSAGPGRDIPCIGASGAISGVMGAYFVLFPRKPIRFLYWLFIFVGTFELPSILAIGAWFFFQYLAAVSMPEGGAVGVAYWAHVWGFLVGAGTMFLLRLTRRITPG